MKNFYDLTAIDTSDRLKLILRIVRHGTISAIIKLNNKILNSDYLIQSFDLFDTIKLEISVLDFIEGSSGIEIAELSINGYEILPKYQHLANPKCNYVDFKSPWVLEIPGPFYVWYHDISGQGWIA
jgi:hypothetical protein